MMKTIRKFLIYSHRYLGIAISLLVVTWFASGIVMMYKGGMPRLSPDLRLDRLAPIDLSQVRLTPAEAADIISAGADGPGPNRGTLVNVLDRPVYRFSGVSVYADTGEFMEELNIDRSREIAARFAGVPAGKVRHLETIYEIDQWTLTQSRQMPMHKFAVDDGKGAEIYIEQATGEVAMHTTSRSRMWAWLGTIPHWFYFTALRDNQPLWYKIVVWTSGAVCVLAALGLAIGTMLLRRPKPFRLKAAIPYSGWMRWHYAAGLVFGVFTLTWAFSGFLSMEPFEWTRAEGIQVSSRIFAGGRLDLSKFGRMDPAVWNSLTDGRALKEVNFVRIDGRDYYDVHVTGELPEEKKRERLHQPYYITGRAEQNRLMVAADTLEIRTQPIPVETLVSRIKAEMPEQKIAEYELLQDYDSYYYSRGRLTPLPVLRVKFADPGESWVYIDPEMGAVLSSIPRLARIERWLYNGLHSLDFSFWYDKRPLWDIGMLLLLAGGLLSSFIGLCLGLKRLARGLAPAKPRVTPQPVTVGRSLNASGD